MLLLRVVAALLYSTLVARAEVPFSITVEKPNRTLDLMSFTTFEFHVTNELDRALRVRAVRVLNDLPDASWYASICSMNTCYPPEVDTTEFEGASARAMTGFTIHVITGSRYGDTATIALQIDTGDGSESVTTTVTVSTAQPPPQLFRIEPVEMVQNVVAGETAEFLIWGYNQAGDTLSLSVERVEDYFTGTGWESRLCVEETCFEAHESTPPSVLLENDRATYFKLKVRTGSAGSGRVILRFNTGRGTEPVEMPFTVNAGISSVDAEQVIALAGSTAFPNPSTGQVTVELPLRHEARVQAVVVGAEGGAATLLEPISRTPRQRGEALTFDLSGLPSGQYWLRIEVGAGAYTVPVTIAK